MPELAHEELGRPTMVKTRVMVKTMRIGVRDASGVRNAEWRVECGVGGRWRLERVVCHHRPVTVRGPRSRALVRLYLCSAVARVLWVRVSPLFT